MTTTSPAPAIRAIRHLTAPTPHGCRWCGFDRIGHSRRWVPSIGWHLWVAPTPEQILARMRARRRLERAS